MCNYCQYPNDMTLEQFNEEVNKNKTGFDQRKPSERFLRLLDKKSNLRGLLIHAENNGWDTKELESVLFYVIEEVKNLCEVI